MQRVLVKPQDGKIVRDPKSKQILPPEGKKIDPKQPYWLRRIKDGDVILCENVEKHETIYEEI